MGRLFIFLCFFSVVSANAQTSDCYGKFMDAGNSALQNKDYTRASQYFESARQCVDISIEQDSAAAAAYADAYDIWTTSLTSARNAADRQALIASDARDSMELLWIESEKNRIAAQKAKEAAEQKAREEEAKRLALVSKDYLDQELELLALETSLEALALDSGDVDVYRAFGNAAFANFNQPLENFDGGVMQIHFRDYDMVAARAKNAIYEKIEERGFKEQGVMAYDAMTTSDKVLYATNIGIITNDHTAALSSVVWTSPAPVSDLMQSPNGSDLIAVCRNNTIYRWSQVTDSLTSPVTFSGHSAPVTSIEFSADGRHLISRALDKSIIMWDLNGTALWSSQFDAFVTAARFSNDDAYVVSATSDGKVYIIDAKSGTTKQTINAHAAAISDCHVLASGNILTSALDGNACLWSWSGNKLGEQNLGGNGIHRTSYSKGSDLVLFQKKDGHIAVYDTDLKLHKSWNPCNGESLLLAVLSADGKYILTSHDNKSIHLWNINGEEVITPKRFDDQSWGCGFTDHSSKFWASSKDGSAWVCTVPHLMYDSLKGRN